MADDQDKILKRARNIVYRLLKFRVRSEKEIGDRLRLKNVPADITRRTIEYFKQGHLIDDRRFAQEWITSRLNKPLGLNRIRFELKQKGIRDDIVQEELAEVRSRYDEVEAASHLARKQRLKYEHLETAKAKGRLFAYLTRRGFAPAAIHRVMQDLYPHDRE